MEKLLEKVKEYGERKRIGEPSLVLETDGSGFIHYSVYDIQDTEPTFEFNSLEELYEEVGYIKNDLAVCTKEVRGAFITEGNSYAILADGLKCYLVKDDENNEVHIFKKYFKKL